MKKIEQLDTRNRTTVSFLLIDGVETFRITLDADDIQHKLEAAKKNVSKVSRDIGGAFLVKYLGARG